MLLCIVRLFSRRNTGAKLLKTNKKSKFLFKKFHKPLTTRILQKHTNKYKRHQYHSLWCIFRRNSESRLKKTPMPFCDKAHNKSMKKEKCYFEAQRIPPNNHHHISLKLVSQKKAHPQKEILLRKGIVRFSLWFRES